MKFLCVADAYDNGTSDKLDKFGRPVRHGYRRETMYEMDEAQVKRLMYALTGVWTEKDAAGKVILERTTIGFLDNFRPADDFATAFLDQHNDELVDIVDQRVQDIKDKPPIVGPAEPARVTLRRKGQKSLAELQADPRQAPAAPGEPVPAPHQLRPRKGGRPKNKAEVAAATVG